MLGKEKRSNVKPTNKKIFLPHNAINKLDLAVGTENFGQKNQTSDRRTNFLEKRGR
jgi:hypothetical protein